MNMVSRRVIEIGWYGINMVEKEIKKIVFFLSIYIEYIELYAKVCISRFYFLLSKNKLT